MTLKKKVYCHKSLYIYTLLLCLFLVIEKQKNWVSDNIYIFNAHNMIITNYTSKSKQINNNRITYSYNNYLFVGVIYWVLHDKQFIILHHYGVGTVDLHFKVQKSTINCDCVMSINFTSITMAKNTFKLFKLHSSLCLLFLWKRTYQVYYISYSYYSCYVYNIVITYCVKVEIIS